MYKFKIKPISCPFRGEFQHAITRVIHPAGEMLDKPILPQRPFLVLVCHDLDISCQHDTVDLFLKTHARSRVHPEMFCFLRIGSRREPKRGNTLVFHLGHGYRTRATVFVHGRQYHAIDVYKRQASDYLGLPLKFHTRAL